MNDNLKRITIDFLSLKKLSFDDILTLLNGYDELKNNYNSEKIWRVLSRYVNNNPDESCGFVYRKFRYNHFTGDYPLTSIFEYFIDDVKISSDAIDGYFNSMVCYFGDRNQTSHSVSLVYKHLATDRYFMINGNLYNPYDDFDYSHSKWFECEPRVYQETRYYEVQ